MLKIITLPNAILRKKSADVNQEFLLKSETQRIIKDLTPTMYAADGVGLAAAQVGHNIRICTIGKIAIPEKHSLPRTDLILVNPVWTKTGLKKTEELEGCLSVPKKYGKVKRYKNIKVAALDASGQPLSFIASDLLARVIQHEVDHLDGVLFIDKAKDIYEVD